MIDEMVGLLAGTGLMIVAVAVGAWIGWVHVYVKKLIWQVKLLDAEVTLLKSNARIQTDIKVLPDGWEGTMRQSNRTPYPSETQS